MVHCKRPRKHLMVFLTHVVKLSTMDFETLFVRGFTNKSINWTARIEPKKLLYTVHVDTFKNTAYESAAILTLYPWSRQSNKHVFYQNFFTKHIHFIYLYNFLLSKFVQRVVTLCTSSKPCYSFYPIKERIPLILLIFNPKICRCKKTPETSGKWQSKQTKATKMQP